MPHARRDDLLFDAEALVRVVRGELRALDAEPVAAELEPGVIWVTCDGAATGGPRPQQPPSHK
jgi:hypothetical protein